MTRRITRRQVVIGGSALVVGSVLLGRCPLPSPQRPNIVFILADDLRWDCVGFMGNPIIQTPHLDALAKESVVFRNAFVVSSICPTSRASILTGEYPMKHGINSFFKPLSTEQLHRTFPLILKDNGYFAAFVGKWGIGWKKPWEKQGELKDAASRLSCYFDYCRFLEGARYRDERFGDRHLTDAQADSAVQFLSEAPNDRPFTLMVSTKAPHFPFAPDRRFKALYRNTVFSPRNPKAAVGVAYQRIMRDYAALITGLDDLVGRIVESLRRSGMLDDTFIFFTSDNGMMLGEHGMEGKGTMFEASIRVPSLMFIPKNHRASVGTKPITDGLVTTVDYAPTILDVAGVPRPDFMQGMSLLEALRTGHTRDEFLYYKPAMYYSSGTYRGVRDRRWKYWERFKDGILASARLFDLENDPFEIYDLARDAQYAEQVQRLRRRAVDLFRQLS